MTIVKYGEGMDTGCYALWREVISPKIQTRPEKFAVPNHAVILIYLIGLATVTFVVRIWYPIDT